MIEINLKRNEEYFYLIGVFLGDGNISFNRIRIAVKDYDFILKCQKCFIKCLNQQKKVKKIINKGTIISYLYLLEFNSIAFSMKVQKDIKNLKNLKNRKKIIAFLEGLYDSEGCVDKNRKRIRLIMRDFSKNVITLISNFLNKYKINHRVRWFYAKERGWYIIDVTGKNCIIFQKLICFSIKRKKERLLFHCQNYKKDWLREAKKREETILLPKRIWCKKYSLTPNQYYRHKRILQ